MLPSWFWLTTIVASICVKEADLGMDNHPNPLRAMVSPIVSAKVKGFQRQAYVAHPVWAEERDTQETWEEDLDYLEDLEEAETIALNAIAALADAE